ncbi:hypothetical protein BKE38_20660 [Pseudoroseomonas deserti]|uniref:HTH cro/C1-type domain-containing protein n=1 Tax=Teichococcus deserti TaxID=1817963 RepID=A0A1V2GXW7_9PROT|nr:hypothetical protein BKE38_20660 [Pseudoroseomonas deserti]
MAVPTPVPAGGPVAGRGVVLREARFSAALVARIRRRLGLTQGDFAERYSIPLRLLRRWEAAELWPDSQALAYLRAIAREPAPHREG